MATQNDYDPENPARKADGTLRTVEEMIALGVDFPDSPSALEIQLPPLEPVPASSSPRALSPPAKRVRKPVQAREDPGAELEALNRSKRAANAAKKTGTLDKFFGNTSLKNKADTGEVRDIATDQVRYWHFLVWASVRRRARLTDLISLL